MTFDEILTAVVDLLQREGRVAYRVLKRRFNIDDEYIEDLKADLIDAKRIATDEDGKVLVWAKAASVQSSTHSPDTGRSDAERRHLTVMFCDLVDSTTLSTLLDPEDLREVVHAYHETCAGVISRYGGHTAQHLGDGLLVYFGYPAAHEDDAQRAVRTGLEILAGLQSLNAQLPSALRVRLPHPIQVRIGIHTGLVVIGEIGSSEKREILALGETPNLAARIQGQANPDEVMISAATYHLVEGLFTCEDRGQPELKGVTTPLTLYRVLNESEAHSRFEVVVRKGLTPLIGRGHEFGMLCERWERVKDGAGQVVLLSGEPGIGKSRLVEALKESVEHEGARCLELRCSPYTQNSALAPVIEHVQRVLGVRSTDTVEEKLHKLIVGAHICVSRRAETIPLLAVLLSLPHPEGYPVLTLSPQKQKEKTHEALVSWLCEEAKQQAVIYAWEDLHWADPSTLELLTLFLQQVPTTRLLTVLTFRPEFVPPWGARSYLSQLSLSRLGRTHVEAMVEKVTGGKALPTEIVQQIVSKTDGVPLFVEELTKSVVESVGAKDVSPLHLGIPTTLQDALMARLDRLGTAKEIAQLGATLGREFTYELLKAVSPLNEDTLQQGLKQVVAVELVYQSGLPPQARYLFKHALVQDTAYQSLLKSRRQQLHQVIGKVLEEQFPQTVEAQPELVAHHYTEARLNAQAIPYWQRAGERATQRSAYVEASNHLTKGLELLKALPETTERIQQELTLQFALSNALIAVKGYTALEVENTVNRARALCQQLGESPQLFWVLVRLFLIYMNRRVLPTARELAEQMMHLAQSVQDQFLLSVAHAVLGCILYLLGELRSAWTHYEQALALYDPQRRSLPTVATADLRVDCLSWESYTLWHLGYPAQALKRSQEAVALAEELSHPFSLAYALGGAAFFHALCREGQLAQERAEASMTLANEHGFPYWLTFGMVVRGWALTLQGQVEDGIMQMQQGLAAYKTTGAGLARPSDLAPLAEAYGRVGQIEKGLAVLAEALATVNKNEERRHEAELYRLKGTLTLQSKFQGPKSKVEEEAGECFLKAIDISRKQQAKSFELRASTSLARLWQQQGKRAEAHKLLSEVYNWFTEGFDTKDLQEAKALLNELI